MNKAAIVLTGVGVGAGLMYMLDPDRGRRRRALARDKATSAWNRSEKYVGKVSRDLANRGRGLAHDAKSALAGGRPEDAAGIGEPDGAGQNWSPSTRVVAAALGGGFAIYGYRRRGVAGKIATALGMGLLTRGVMNQGGPLGTGPFGKLGDKVASMVGSGIESVTGSERRRSPSAAH